MVKAKKVGEGKRKVGIKIREGIKIGGGGMRY